MQCGRWSGRRDGLAVVVNAILAATAMIIWLGCYSVVVVTSLSLLALISQKKSRKPMHWRSAKA
jgi:hypothetical protein